MQGKRFLHSLRLTNLLSYGSAGESLALEPLNVLIGPNASGKSNLIEAISLLAAAPKDLARPMRQGEGVKDWLWKGAGEGALAGIDTSFDFVSEAGAVPLTYRLSFSEARYRLRVVEEDLFKSDEEDSFFFDRTLSQVLLRTAQTLSDTRVAEVNIEESILSQIRDPFVYPELTFLSGMLEKIRFFRERSFGRKSVLRMPQRAELLDDFLADDAGNLALVINLLKNRPPVKRLILEKLKLLYDDVEDIETAVLGGTIQVVLHEKGDRTISSSRLSDGTLQYLCLLAILCHPEPPPLICIEEPELGLHPDILPTVAELLVEAAQRTQLIVTTHSETLVSALTEIPESVVVCERSKDGTRLRRLEADKLRHWLDEYKLGEVWRAGEIGGNRW